MSEFTLIHNPRCSKSRQTLEILNSKGIEPKIVLYLEETLTEDFLRDTFSYLGMKPSECLRTKEDDFIKSKVDMTDEDSIIEAIIKFPKILERPIVIHKSKAVIGRPPENVLAIIS